MRILTAHSCGRTGRGKTTRVLSNHGFSVVQKQAHSKRSVMNLNRTSPFTGSIRRVRRIGFVLIAAGLLCSNARAAGTDTVLWYEAPTTNWNEALPVGNGRLGAMIFGGVASERLQL